MVAKGIKHDLSRSANERGAARLIVVYQQYRKVFWGPQVASLTGMITSVKCVKRQSLMAHGSSVLAMFRH